MTFKYCFTKMPQMYYKATQCFPRLFSDDNCPSSSEHSKCLEATLPIGLCNGVDFDTSAAHADLVILFSSIQDKDGAASVWNVGIGCDNSV